MEATMFILYIIIASRIFLASGNQYDYHDKGTFPASDRSNTQIDGHSSCDNTNEGTSVKSAEKKSSVSESDAQGYMNFSVRSHVPWTSWIDCPPFCNGSEGGTFRMRSFRSSSEKNQTFELKFEGYTNSSGKRMETRITTGHPPISEMKIHFCYADKRVMEFFVVDTTKYKSLCLKDVRNKTTLCAISDNRKQRDGGISCYCIYVFDLGKTEAARSVNVTSATSLEDHTMVLQLASSMSSNNHKENMTSLSTVVRITTEQWTSTMTNDLFYKTTSKYPPKLTIWILIAVSVVTLVTILFVGVFKATRRLKKKRTEPVDDTTQSGHNYTDISIVDNEQHVQELECVNLDTIENEYDIAFHWEENNLRQSNIYDHVCQPYYQVSFNCDKKEVDPENDYETASNVHRNIT